MKPDAVTLYEVVGTPLLEVVEAVQYDGRPNRALTIMRWTEDKVEIGEHTHPDGSKEHCLLVETPSGRTWIEVGDWLIRNQRGEYVTCKPGEFDSKYKVFSQPIA